MALFHRYGLDTLRSGRLGIRFRPLCAAAGAGCAWRLAAAGHPLPRVSGGLGSDGSTCSALPNSKRTGVWLCTGLPCTKPASQPGALIKEQERTLGRRRRAPRHDWTDA
jgi:hypothetical protein